jgi:hypothetical protein
MEIDIEKFHSALNRTRIAATYLMGIGTARSLATDMVAQGFVRTVDNVVHKVPDYHSKDKTVACNFVVVGAGSGETGDCRIDFVGGIGRFESADIVDQLYRQEHLKVQQESQRPEASQVEEAR